MPTLESYLKRASERGVIDHALRAHVRPDGKVAFYIHPAGVDGETRDYLTYGVAVIPCNVVPPAAAAGTPEQTPLEAAIKAA